MRRLFVVLILFFSISTASAFNLMFTGGGKKSTGGGEAGCGDCVLEEAFDGSESGFDTAGWSITEAGGNDFEPDDSTTYVSSPDNGTVDVADAAYDCYASNTYTEQTGTVYLRAKIYIEEMDTEGTTLFAVRFVDATGNEGVKVSIRRGIGSAYFIRAWSNLNNDEMSGASLDTWYTVYIKYYSDGSTPTEWYVNAADQGTMTAGTDRDLDTVWIGGDSGDHSGGGIVRVDDVMVSPTGSDVGWPG